jgi:uncharacterized membrane protein HdeD (DUF308 family)
MSEHPPSAHVPEHRRRWKWFLAIGVFLLVLGVTGVSAATLLTWTSMLLFGPMLLASSFIQLFAALFVFAEKGKQGLLLLIAAGLEALLGFLVMAHPLQTVVSLAALVAIFFVAIGLVRLARSLATHSRRRAWIVMTGVVALLLGISVWLGWPVAQVWFVGLCIAIDFLCQGLSWWVLGMAEREPAAVSASAAPQQKALPGVTR